MLLMLLLIGNVYAEEIQYTLPNSNIPDTTKKLVIEGKVVYQTLPSSSVRDYSKPSYTIENGKVYQNLPNSNIKGSTPIAVIRKGK